jgi:hypothetical protein
MDVLGCRTFFSELISIFVFNKMQIPSGCIQNCSLHCTHLHLPGYEPVSFFLPYAAMYNSCFQHLAYHSGQRTGVCILQVCRLRVVCPLDRTIRTTYSPACHRGGTGSIPGQSLWRLLWRKWHWGCFFSEYIDFSLSELLHQYSINIPSLIT